MKYYIKAFGHTIEDAEEVSGFMGDSEGFAEIAAQYFFNCRDGWECTWPIVFTVIGNDGIETDFEVAMEMIPEFYASEIIPTPEGGEKWHQ